MRKLIFTPFVFLILIASISYAQTQRSDYKKVDYIQVDKDMSQQFLKTVQQKMKPAYKKMIENGDIRSWQLYAVRYPGGERSKYNVVCVVTAPEVNTFEDNAFSEMESMQFTPASDGKNEMGKLASMTKLVASEIWKVRSLLATDTARTEPGQYMTMDYMKVPEGSGPAYLTLEDEVAKPLHQARIEKGTMSGWEMYSLVLPGGTEYGYSYATGNFFDHIGDMEFGFTNALIKQTLPGTNVSDLLNTIYETRDLVKSELWQLIDHAE